MTAKTRVHKDDLGPESAAPQDEVEALAETAGRYARKVLDETHHMTESADNLVAAMREEPVKTALIALGIGAVIGMMVRR